MDDQPSFASLDVLQGHLIIAGITRACFGAGDIAVLPQVPKARQNHFLKSEISNLKSFAFYQAKLCAFVSLREGARSSSALKPSSESQAPVNIRQPESRPVKRSQAIL
jgi:hypothetical protein